MISIAYTHFTDRYVSSRIRRKCLVWALSAALPVTITCQQTANASEAMIVGGGSHVHNSHNRFEESARWVGSVLSEQDVRFTTHFNDGQAPELDTYYNVEDATAIQALGRVFNASDLQPRNFRNHTLNNVETSTHLDELKSAIEAKLADSPEDELLLIHSGHGSYSGDTEDNVSMNLWGDTKLTAARLHQWLMPHERPVRFVIGHSHSGGFHRLAYRDPSNGLALNDITHCGFTSNSTHGTAELAMANPDTSDYRDYLSYFFSAISGYEYDGEIISRFSDLNEDGQTSLREAHLFTLEEAMSVDLPLSTSEDYLHRWQPWYLRWQPSPKLLPNNEYSRIFRDVANRMKIPLEGNVAKEIRNRLTLVSHQLHVIERRQSQEIKEIAALQSTIQTAVTAQWPALANPYSQGFQTLLKSDQVPQIESFIEQFQPAYTELLTRQDQTQASDEEYLGKRREQAQFHKLLKLRHLALIKQQLFEHGTEQQIADYRSLLTCEQAPLYPSIRTTVLTEETNQ